MGRPSVKIDWIRVNQLLEAGCLGTEVAAHFGMHPNTFYRHVEIQYKMSFSDVMQQKRSKGDSILRETQFNLAVDDKDRGMLIWLGKQRLNQREPQTYETNELANNIIKIIDFSSLKKEKDEKNKNEQ